MKNNLKIKLSFASFTKLITIVKYSFDKIMQIIIAKYCPVKILQITIVKYSFDRI